MANRVLEDRAAFAVLREIYWQQHRVTDIHRPEDHPQGHRGRLVDFVFDLDGSPCALEVVRYGLGQATIDAGHRISTLETYMRERLTELIPDDDQGTVSIELAYNVGETLKLGRRSIGAAARELAEASVEAIRSHAPGTRVDLQLTGRWAGQASATFRASDSPHRYFFRHPAGGARHLQPEVDEWILDVVEKKGDQHLPFAERGILAIIQTDIVDAHDLRRGLERYDGAMPWWRIYVLDLAVDSADLVRDRRWPAAG
jgi:hypothetical protein